MITISLDEQGNFEQTTATKHEKEEPLFIGGIIYDDLHNKSDARTEEDRIILYLQAVCISVNAIFPDDMHLAPAANNNRKVGQVKKAITDTLPEFLQSGSVSLDNNLYADQLNEMPCREGKYYIFCYVKYGTSIKRLEQCSTSILMREGYASNLYIHMAEEIVGRLVFHNPIIKNVDKVGFDLAKRRVVLDEGSDKEIKEYINLGYLKDKDSKWTDKHKVSFVLTNPDVYRTAIEREMMNSERMGISIDHFRVKSIDYKQRCDEDGNEKPNRNAFLYLADSICSNLGYKADISSPESLVDDFKKKADAFTGHNENLIFVYDDVDLIFKKAWAKLEEREYYETLRMVHQGKEADSPYAPYYTKVWFERIKDRLLEEKDVVAYGVALRKCFLLTHSNNLQQDELIDIYKMLEEMLGKMKFRNAEEIAVLYDLYDAGTSAYCHIGDSIHARECFDKCLEYAKYVDVERYLRTRNKMVVFLTDSFLFDEAFKIAEENISLQEELLAVRELIFDKSVASVDYGIALSQKGQICSLLHKPEGERVFQDALDQFAEGTTDKSDPNYMQTLSYLLHYYIEMGDKVDYDSWSVHYFGDKKSLRDQFYYVLKGAVKGEESAYSMKFALYVFVKALYLFHLDDLSDELAEKLCDIKNEIYSVAKEKGIEQMKDHPWEIIYKYLALIAMKRGRTEQAEEYVKEIRTSLENIDPMLDAICTFGEMEYARETGDEKTEEERLNIIESIFKDNRYEVYDAINWEDMETAYHDLKEKVLNYMYS